MYKNKFNTFSIVFISTVISITYMLFAYRHFYSILCGISGPLDHINHAHSGIHLLGELRNGKAGIKSFLNSDPYPLIILYPIWHVMVFLPFHFLNTILNADVALSISITLIDWLFLISTLIVIYHILKKTVISVSPIILYTLSILLLLVGPLDGSSIYGSYYLGAYTGNPWHSPTYIAVRPIALLTISYYIELLSIETKDLMAYIKATLLLLLSAFLKPSFYQVFLPGLVIYCIVQFIMKPTKQSFISYFYIALTCLPVGAIALFQLFALPSSAQESSIGVGFLYVWKAFTSNWVLSLLYSIAFPLACCLLMLIKRHWSTASSIVFLTFLSAMLQYMFFYIKAFPYSADFSWGFDLAIFFAFVFSLQELLQMLQSISTRKTCLLLYITYGCILTAHLYFGIRYFYSVFVLNQFGGPLPHLFQ